LWTGRQLPGTCSLRQGASSVVRNESSIHGDRVILFDDRSVSAGRMTGWERYATEVGKRLERQTFKPAGITIRGLPSRLRSDWLDLPRAARHEVGTFMPTFPPTPTQDLARVVWVLHDLTWLNHPNWSSRLGRSYYRPLANRAIANVAHIVTISDAVRGELIAGGVDPKRVTRVYPGASKLLPAGETASVDMATRFHRPFALAVGTSEPRKNLHILSTCWEDSAISSQIDLVIAGRIAWGGGHDSNVIHVDTPTDTELSWLYSNAAVFVQPSLYEGFGLPIVEARYFGTPIVCSDIPVFREVAPVDALFFDPHDVQALRKCISQALRRHPSGGPDHTDIEFRWEDTAKQLAEVCLRWLT
jgi:glycosyltransferase involved in cell wall biosynthesis